MYRRRGRGLFGWCPEGIPSAVVLLAILWLTLSPRPIGEFEFQIFPGADKILHAVMFAGLTFTVGFDFSLVSRKNRLMLIVILWLTASLVGCTIEFAQKYMDLGRGFESADMIADAIGSLLGIAAYCGIEKYKHFSGCRKIRK